MATGDKNYDIAKESTSQSILTKVSAAGGGYYVPSNNLLETVFESAVSISNQSKYLGRFVPKKDGCVKISVQVKSNGGTSQFGILSSSVMYNHTTSDSIRTHLTALATFNGWSSGQQFSDSDIALSTYTTYSSEDAYGTYNTKQYILPVKAGCAVYFALRSTSTGTTASAKSLCIYADEAM